MLGDRRLGALVDEAPPVFTGIGGTAVRLEIDGRPVFAKRVPLTDLERRPDNVMSTANLFGLPAFYHYGVGSAGAGVWRELAAQTMTTNWVLAGRTEAFPLLYHWRVLPRPSPRTPTPDQRADRNRMVEYWHGSPAVRERLGAIARSSASVVLFLEYLPQNLLTWLTAQVADGPDAVARACAMVERSLRTDTSFMNSNGLVHFDAHFGNLLTDGRRLYFADLGLAASPRFELSEAESRFLDTNLSHDGCFTVTQLVNWLVTALSGAVDAAKPARLRLADRNEHLRRYADGAPSTMPPPAAAIIERYAPIAVVMNAFYWTLRFEDRTTPYPVDELRRVCAATGFEPVLPPPGPSDRDALGASLPH